jgi:hypothetical protein
MPPHNVNWTQVRPQNNHTMFTQPHIPYPVPPPNPTVGFQPSHQPPQNMLLSQQPVPGNIIAQSGSQKSPIQMVQNMIYGLQASHNALAVTMVTPQEGGAKRRRKSNSSESTARSPVRMEMGPEYSSYVQQQPFVYDSKCYKNVCTLQLNIVIKLYYDIYYQMFCSCICLLTF